MLFDTFLNIKPVKVLVILLDKKKIWYASMIAKEADVTYAHLIKLLDIFADENLVIFERQGRVKIVRLTDRGEELAHEFETVLRRLEAGQNQRKTKGGLQEVNQDKTFRSKSIGQDI